MFAEGLKARMQEISMSQKNLARLTGIGKETIAMYLSGEAEIPACWKQVMAEAVHAQVEELDRYHEDQPEPIERISVKDAARILGMAPETLRRGLEQGAFPWGYYINGERKTYWINKKKLIECEGLSM